MHDVGPAGAHELQQPNRPAWVVEAPTAAEEVHGAPSPLKLGHQMVLVPEDVGDVDLHRRRPDLGERDE